MWAPSAHTVWTLFYSALHRNDNVSMLKTMLCNVQCFFCFAIFLVTFVFFQKFCFGWENSTCFCFLRCCTNDIPGKIWFRAHQTPAARIKLCWKPMGDEGKVYRHCAFLRTWRITELNVKHFTVTPKQYIQVHCLSCGFLEIVSLFSDNIKIRKLGFATQFILTTIWDYRGQPVHVHRKNSVWLPQ